MQRRRTRIGLFINCKKNKAFCLGHHPMVVPHALFYALCSWVPLIDLSVSLFVFSKRMLDRNNFCFPHLLCPCIFLKMLCEFNFESHRNTSLVNWHLTALQCFTGEATRILGLPTLLEGQSSIWYACATKTVVFGQKVSDQIWHCSLA